MTTMPLSDVKAHLSEIVGRVNGQHERVTVTVHGQPSAVLLSVDDLASLEETLTVLADAASLARLRDSADELARGEGESADDLRRAMAARAAREA